MKSQKNIFKGLKVLELANVLAGPAVGMFFAELGATVIKVENKNTGGDVTRQWKLPAEKNKSGVSAYYASVNWKKKSVFLNLNDKKDSIKLFRLIQESDVVITNQTVTSLKKHGLDYKTLKQINPLLIHANLTGYGEKNNRHAFDIVLQAETGYMSMNGTKKSGPLKMPVALIDVLAAHQLKEAILVALLQKQKNNKGAYVTVSLYDTAIASLANQASNWLMAGYLPGLAGSIHPNIAPYGETFITKDKKQLVLAVGNDKQFKEVCDTIGLPELPINRLFKTNSLRVKNRHKLYFKLFHAFKILNSKDIIDAFNRINVPYGICKTIKEVFSSPMAQNMVLKEKNGSKRVKTVVFSLK